MMNMVKREPHHNRKTAALILAAGEGSRMGRRPKCLIKIDQQPIILRQIKTLKAAGIDLITIVTGFHHQEIETVIARDAALRIIRNPAPEQGQQSSVELGLQNISGKPDLILIALSDQPLIEESDIRELLRAYDGRPVNTDILYPVVGGQRGNPVLMSGVCVDDFLKDTSGITCRQYIDRHASIVYPYRTQNDHFIADLDTKEDLDAIRNKTNLDITL